MSGETLNIDISLTTLASASGENLKSEAIICRLCCTEYREAQVDIEFENEVLYNVKVLQCPKCGDEVLTPELYKAVEKWLFARCEAKSVKAKK